MHKRKLSNNELATTHKSASLVWQEQGHEIENKLHLRQVWIPQREISNGLFPFINISPFVIMKSAHQEIKCTTMNDLQKEVPTYQPIQECRSRSMVKGILLKP